MWYKYKYIIKNNKNQSHNFNTPSHPHVTTLLGSIGCHSTPIHTLSWAFLKIKDI